MADVEVITVSGIGVGPFRLAAPCRVLPGRWYTRAAGPLVRVFQAIAARAYVRAVRRVCAQAE